MKANYRFVKELGISDNNIPTLLTPKKNRKDSDVSFYGLNKANEKNFHIKIS